MSRPRERGQVLILAILIMAALIASIPLLVSVVSRWNQSSVQAKATQEVDETAKAAFAQIAYALETTPGLWNRVLAGKSLKDAGYDGESRFQGLHNSQFTVVCAHDAALLPDQIKVSITVLQSTGTAKRARLYEALFTHKTMGVDLPDIAHSPAALYALGDLRIGTETLNPPELDVHWGSIVCFGSFSFRQETGAAKWGHHPRTFSRMTYSPPYPIKSNTDDRSYWSGYSMGTPVEIDEAQYKVAAQQKGDAAQTVESMTAGGFIDMPDQTVAFRATSDAPDVSATPVYYINASIQFESAGVDLGRGAAIITHNAVFTGEHKGDVMRLNVPAHADREYPYLQEGSSFPCQRKMGATCSSTEATGGDGLVDFRGFLYVKGDLYIERDTIIAGVVRVDGQLKIASGKTLTIFFDDKVSHAILLKGTAIQQQIVTQAL